MLQMIAVITVMFTLILNIYKYLGRFFIWTVSKLLNPENVKHQPKSPLYL